MQNCNCNTLNFLYNTLNSCSNFITTCKKRSNYKEQKETKCSGFDHISPNNSAGHNISICPLRLSWPAAFSCLSFNPHKNQTTTTCLPVQNLSLLGSNHELLCPHCLVTVTASSLQSHYLHV